MKIDISHIRIDSNQKVNDYVHKKIGRLEKFAGRHARKSAHAKVILSETKGKLKKPTCEAILDLPGATLTAKESYDDMFSSIDAVESKLSVQVRRYKQKHSPSKSRQAIRKFMRRS